MDAELDALICSAGRTGNKFSYQLLDDAVPVSDVPGYEESIAELAKRYFFSRGPASIQDFAWWGNLTLSEAKKGLDMNKRHLHSVSVNGKDYWVSLQFAAECSHGLRPVIIYDGQVAGTWRRTEIKKAMHIETKFFKDTPQTSPRSLATAIKKYIAFAVHELRK